MGPSLATSPEADTAVERECGLASIVHRAARGPERDKTWQAHSAPETTAQKALRIHRAAGAGGRWGPPWETVSLEWGARLASGRLKEEVEGHAQA